MFQKSVHDCPYCSFELDRADLTCSRCQSHLETLGPLPKDGAVLLESIMDLAGLLQGDAEKVKKMIARSEKKFPQLKLIFCSIVCPENFTPNTLGWWMLNQGTNPQLTWTGLLLVDPASSQITFQAGYDLEIFIDRRKLETLLTECGQWFTLGEWSTGAEKFFQNLHLMLKNAHQESREIEKQALKLL